MDDKLDEIITKIIDDYISLVEGRHVGDIRDAKSALKSLMNEYAIEHADRVIGEDEEGGIAKGTSLNGELYMENKASKRHFQRQLRAEQRQRNKIETEE